MKKTFLEKETFFCFYNSFFHLQKKKITIQSGKYFLLSKHMNRSLHQAIQEMENELFQGDLSDIIEVTYAYTQLGEYFLNRTLFEDFI
jgi:hypothetical protein